MSRSIRNVIKKRAIPYDIQRFDRDAGYYDDDDGLWVESKEVKETVKLHLQPIVDKLTDVVSSQEQTISWRGWTLDTVANKDVVTVDGGLYTISDMILWPNVFREFNLTRSGETDNIDDT